MKILLAGIALLCVLCAGCATTVDRSALGEIDATKARIETLHAQIREDAIYQVEDNAVVLGEPLPLAPENRYPAALDAPYVYAQDASGTLEEAANILAAQAGLAIRVTTDAAARARAMFPAHDGSDDIAGGFAFTARGSLRSILSQLAITSGTSWRWTGSEVRLFYVDTRVFDISVLPTTMSIDNEITNATETTSSGSGGGAGGSQGQGSAGAATGGIDVQGGSAQSMRNSFEFKLYDDVQQTIKSMLTPEVGSVAVSPSTSTITVRDTESVIEAVAAYVDGVNQRLQRQVAIELTILSVEQSDANSFGLNWDIVRQALGGTYRIDALGTATAPADSNAALVSIVDPDNEWSGSSLLVQALASSMNGSVERTSLITAMNNQPVRVQSASQDAFLVSVQTTLVPDAGAQTTTTAISKTTGLSLTLLPLILDDHTVLLDVQGTLSTPREPKRRQAAGTELELPRTASEDFSQRARLRSGASLVLTGFDQTNAGYDRRGVGSAKFSLLGGGRNSAKARRTLVVLITPRVVG